MRTNSAVFWGETESDGKVERIKHLHLSIKPLIRIGTERIGPTQSGPELAHAQSAEMPSASLEAMVFEMEPLANA